MSQNLGAWNPYLCVEIQTGVSEVGKIENKEPPQLSGEDMGFSASLSCALRAGPVGQVLRGRESPAYGLAVLCPLCATMQSPCLALNLRLSQLSITLYIYPINSSDVTDDLSHWLNCHGSESGSKRWCSIPDRSKPSPVIRSPDTCEAVRRATWSLPLTGKLRFSLSKALWARE